MERVVVCICTYLREALLAECLESLAHMRLPQDSLVDVVVIDNDAKQSLCEFVVGLGEAFPHPLHYRCEQKRGIPCARNTAIEVAHELKADYLVFIDDDEQVEPDWLVELLGYCRNKGGKAVIHGAVDQRLPKDTPDHVQAIYQPKRRKTGESLTSCATNNVIVPIFITQEMGLRFDESNPLAGGTDTIFFTDATRRGVEIFECNEALVKETIPAERATLTWLSKRKFRAGITEAWRKQQKGRSKVSVFISAVLQLIIEMVKTAIATLLLMRVSRNRFWLKACKVAGVCAGLFGAKVDSYKNIDGQGELGVDK